MKLYVDLTAGTLKINEATFGISCRVRSIKSGDRKKSEVVRTVSVTPPFIGEPYDPLKFPRGTWKITAIEYQNNYKFDTWTYGPVKIRTNAQQTVKIWLLDSDGDYLHETTEVTVDWGYLLHYSESSTTTGCIRFNSGYDAISVAELIEEASRNKEEVFLEVV